MPKSNGLEFRILKYALEVGGDHGRTSTWAELRHCIAQETGECRDDELRAAFVKLRSQAFIVLQKWDETKKRLRDYEEYQGMYEFFMRGSFRVMATSLGCAYWEALLYERIDAEGANGDSRDKVALGESPSSARPWETSGRADERQQKQFE